MGDFLQSVSDCSTDDDSLLDTDSNFSLENIDSPIELLFEEPSEPSNPEISLHFELPCVKKTVSRTQTTIIDENHVEVKKSCLKTQRKVSTAARYLGPYPKEKVEKKKAETEAADGELFHLQQRNLELKKYSYNLEIEKSLANYHPWFLRHTAKLAVYALPSRHELLTKLYPGCYNVHKSHEQLHQASQTIQRLYSNVDGLFTKHNLHDLP